MQPLNDHMEDMIRRAAQDYPLDTRGADWNRVQKKLSDKEKRRRSKAWLLLLLLPLGVIGYFYFPSTGDERVTSETKTEKQLITHPKEKKQSSSSKITSQTAVADKKQETLRSVVSGKFSLKNPTLLSSALTTQKAGAVFENSIGGEDASPPELLKESESSLHNEKTSVAAVPLSDRKLSFNLSVPDAKFASLNLGFTPAVRTKKFYFGIVGAMDATTIHFQKVDRTGNRAGLLAGFVFSKKFSVETGFFSTKKSYYTSGEYFDKSKLGAPSTWVIIDVNGNCRMIEVPLALRYNFAQAPTGNWFATAGMRSYIIQQENYEYDALYSSGTSGLHSYSYKTGQTRMAADVSLSAGYQWSLGGFADVRVEPFVQLPVRSMGVGNLKFTSAGVQVGLTRKMF